MAESAAQKKRSAAAKKAAETRKKNQEAEEQDGTTERQKQEAEQGDQPQATGQNLAETDEARQGDTAEDRDPGPYVPRHRPLQNADFDDKAAEEKRQAELAEERRVGLLRTAGQPVD